MIRLNVVDTVSPVLKSRAEQLSPAGRRRMLALASRAVLRLVKDHFADRERGSPNKKGFPRTHFWRREGHDKSAVVSLTPDQAVIGIGSPAIGMRYTGGTIRPGPGKRFLAIPLTAEAYGRRPSERHIPGLFVRRVLSRAFLATRDGAALRVHYLLVRSVVQPADPDTLPRPSRINRVVQDAVTRHLIRSKPQ